MGYITSRTGLPILVKEKQMSIKTDISILLDRSGSMMSVLTDTIGGFNSFLEEQKKVDSTARLTLVRFNTRYEQVYSLNLPDCPPLTRENFVPSGDTALYDSLCRLIDETGERLKNMPEGDRPKQVVIVIISDGQENRSLRNTLRDVQQRIKHQTDVYQWQFVYIGVNEEAIVGGNDLEAIPAGSRMDKEQLTSGGLHLTPQSQSRNAYNLLSANMKTYRKQDKSAVCDFFQA